MALPTRTVNGMPVTDFSSLDRRYVYVVDNNNRHFLVDTRTQTRYEAGGPGQRAGVRAIWGEPLTSVYLTGFQQGPAVQDLYGGPNGIEQVVAGLRPDPLTGKVNPNPQAITSVAGIPYEPTPTPKAAPAPKPPPRNFLEELRTQYPYYPDGFLRAWAGEWQDTGDPDLALAQVRQNRNYEKYWFPGIRRDDGSLRLSEGEYVQTKRGYHEAVSKFGVSPSMLEHKFTDWMRGEVSAAEAEERMAMAYQEVMSRGDEIKRYYADAYGSGNISEGALLASFVLARSGERVSPHILQQRARTAQIGGEFSRTGFDLELSEAVRLTEFGLGQEAARKLAQSARLQLPVLEALVGRHNDPDDDFELTEFLEASVFADPEQTARIQRLFAQETSSFSPTAGMFAQSGGPGVRGLTPR